jgi:nicotinamidase-related amidase
MARRRNRRPSESNGDRLDHAVCLQRDFVDPIGPHDPLPNLLHVGYSEASRLLGPEPDAGPLAQLIQWARGLPSDAIDFVHIRDWHDPDDPAQREHLLPLGAHCIKGTVGARLVLERDERAEAAPNDCIVDSITRSSPLRRFTQSGM